MFTLFCIQIKLNGEMKVAFWIFFIVAPPQKLVVAPGATIRDNTVPHLHVQLYNTQFLQNASPVA